jgi:peptidoglycan-associated lipoprotein
VLFEIQAEQEKDMKGASLKWVLVVIAALLVTACSSTGSKKDTAQTGARVEERGMAQQDGAGTQSQGLADDATLAGGSLDDPNSPLAVRVIYFDYDSANIREDFNETVAAHAAYLAANSSASVTLEGHADERGSREYNLALGERRALAVRRQLVLLGASAGQIRTVSYGEERPAVDGHDEQSYGLNRRVELVY